MNNPIFEPLRVLDGLLKDVGYGYHKSRYDYQESTSMNI